MTWFCPHAFSNIFLFHRYHPSTNLQYLHSNGHASSWPLSTIKRARFPKTTLRRSRKSSSRSCGRAPSWKSGCSGATPLFTDSRYEQKNISNLFGRQHMKWKHTVDTTFSGTIWCHCLQTIEDFQYKAVAPVYSLRLPSLWPKSPALLVVHQLLLPAAHGRCLEAHVSRD